MKKARKISLTIIAALAIALVYLFAFSDQQTGSDILAARKIGVFVYQGDDTFISNMTSSLRTISSEFGRDTGERLYLSVQDAQGSQTTQNSQIERHIALGYDALCVNLVDRTSAGYIAQMAMEANIPVVFYNREPVKADLEKWDKLYYVGTDAAQNGLMQGAIIADLYEDERYTIDRNRDGYVQYIMIEGEFRHQDSVLRTEGSVEALLDAGIMLEKLDGGVGNWERAQGAALAREYFDEYGSRIELIICNNDDMALGVIDYLDASGIDFDNILGIDGTPEGLEAVNDGKMLGTVVIDYRAQAQFVFDVAYELIRNRNPASVVSMTEDRVVRAPMYVVTRD